MDSQTLGYVIIHGEGGKEERREEGRRKGGRREGGREGEREGVREKVGRGNGEGGRKGGGIHWYKLCLSRYFILEHCSSQVMQ